jgi:capsular polysaccharide biosynthesis protein
MEENEEIDLKDFFRILWKGKDVILIFTVIGVVIGYVYTMFLLKPKYTSYTKLIMVQTNASGDNSKSITQTDVTMNDKLVATYQSLATTNSVVREVISNLGLNESEDSLRKKISVTSEKSTQVIIISVTDSNPEISAEIANELSEVFSRKISEIYKIDNINIVDKAEVPTKPSNVNHKKDILIFAVAGFIVAVILVFLKNIFDNTVSTKEEVEKELNVIVLNEIPDCTDLISHNRNR